MALLSEKGSLPELQKLSTRLEDIESGLDCDYQQFVATEEDLTRVKRNTLKDHPPSD